VLALRPTRRPMRQILAKGAHGLLLRWLLPGSAMLLVGLGWIVARLREATVLAPGEGTALMLYGGLILLFALLMFASSAVARQEKQARRIAGALHEREARSEAILHSALDAVVLFDAAGCIFDWNPSAERKFGWSRAEVLGQCIDTVLPDFWHLPPEGAEAARRLEPGSALPERTETTAVRKDGSAFAIELSINRLPGAGDALFVLFARDITLRKSAEATLLSAKEAAESANRAKDNFMAALSHELRTPLSPVLMCVAVLRDDLRLPPEVRADLRMIARNIALEARLIDDLLDVTRIIHGKLRLRLEPCDVHYALGYAVEIVREDALAKRVGIVVSLQAAHSGLRGDPARLQQLFWNLLKNAVKFTPGDGEIVVTSLNDGDRLIIEITDTGVGFAPEQARQLFEPFEQAGRTGDHRFGGLGLGLAIVRSIVELHGGSVKAQSPGADGGATFTVTFNNASLAPVLPDAPPDAGFAFPQPALSLLVVEDHEPTLEVLAKMLMRAGHCVVAVSTVSAALAALEVGVFDALISDLGLPDGTGLELLGRIRVRHPSLFAIALSGYGMEDDVAHSRQAGFAAHLVKPIEFPQLERVLRRCTRSVPRGLDRVDGAAEILARPMGCD
jgi:PAS domain S-box-containing protein